METTCPRCEKPLDLCVCADVQPSETRLHVLILQHPQEPDKEIGTARLAHLSLPNSTLKIGLSWPNLKKILGRETSPARWAVLYLGSGIKGEAASGLTFVDKKGAPLPDQGAVARELEGIILLDGTWSQAKALWWRNAWLLKCRRAILNPKRKSLYGELRREPRRESISTIESVAEALEALGESSQTGERLRESFKRLLVKYRARGPRKRA